MRYGSWWVGTHVSRPWPRRGVTFGLFIFVAACGALFPWPWCLWVLSFGLLNVFIVFRHWSHDEDEAKSHIGPEDKQIRIDGDLSIEMAGASAFVLVYATTAFAQIQAARQGFQMPPDAGAFTFIRYALVEGLKVAPLVTYYDLFADNLHFRQLGAVTAASISAKSAVLAFRAALDLIILAGLKRCIDIARRAAEGLDLRPILAVLSDLDADQAAVELAVGNSPPSRRAAAGRPQSCWNKSSPRCGSASCDTPPASGSPPRMVSFATRSRVRSSGKLLVAIDGYRSSPMTIGGTTALRWSGPRRNTLSVSHCARSANARAAQCGSKRRWPLCKRL